MDEELKHLQGRLEQLRPNAMPEDMVARMAQAMDHWREHQQDEVVPFTVPEAKKHRKSTKVFNMWASAAACVLLAAVSILFFAEQQSEEQTEHFAEKREQPMIEVLPEPIIGESDIMPASIPLVDSAIKSSQNGNITYDAHGRAMRVMRVHFEDVVKFEGKNGKTYTIRKPRVEYYVVPVEVH